MIIRADKEGRAVLVQICDQARKVCDLNSVGSILQILNLIEDIPEKAPKKPEKKSEKKKE